MDLLRAEGQKIMQNFCGCGFLPVCSLRLFCTTTCPLGDVCYSLSGGQRLPESRG